ncbi:hypothetical protein PTKIN_Ptkin08bG0158000 [Pterospermum kingtungense]
MRAQTLTLITPFSPKTSIRRPASSLATILCSTTTFSRKIRRRKVWRHGRKARAVLLMKLVVQHQKAATCKKCKSGVKKNKIEQGHRVAFRMKSEMEVIDDGYKWRKYGKKSVKNSPNPRNYYKCSSGGCSVKKRIERDRDDKSYVITSYEGVHNHESPYMVYYNQMPLMAPNAWALHTSPPSSSST